MAAAAASPGDPLGGEADGSERAAGRAREAAATETAVAREAPGWLWEPLSVSQLARGSAPLSKS